MLQNKREDKIAFRYIFGILYLIIINIRRICPIKIIITKIFFICIFIPASLFSFSLSFSFFAFVRSRNACVFARISNSEFLYLVPLPRIARGLYKCVLRIFHMHSEIKRGRCKTFRKELSARARTSGRKYCDRIASCHANRPDFINAPAPWHGTLLSRPFFFTGHEVRAWSSKIRMRYVSHVLIYRSITTLVECSIRILRLIATGGADKVCIAALYVYRFILRSRGPIHTFSVSCLLRACTRDLIRMFIV